MPKIASPSHIRPTGLKRFHYGAPYYPEHWPAEEWAQDMKRMADAGMNLIRLAEFAWALLEPDDGVYDFTLFDRAIDLAHEHGLSVMMCTPTATPPRWLTHRYPEVLRVDADGRSMSHGSRQHASHMSPTFREYSQRITRAMAEHYRNHPAVIGWQTDNEIHCHFSEDHSDAARDAFIQWCREKYNDDIDRLNTTWGTIFWSNTYYSFDELVTPRSNAPTHLNPAHRLDYARFLSDAAAAFQHDQVEILRQVNPPWWITHNGTFRHIDYRGRFVRDLDFLAYDSYAMFCTNPADRPASHAFNLDRCRGWSGNFLIPEQQSGACAQTDFMMDSPAPGELRQLVYRSIARGADGLMLFRWRSCRFGSEQYWQGLIDHDNVGRRRYQEAAQVGHEIKELGPQVLGTHVHIDTAVAASDMNVTDGFEVASLGLPSPAKVGESVHRCLFDCGLAVGCVHPSDDLSQLKLYIISHWAYFDPDWVAPLQAWIKAGGTLVIGALTATRDKDNNIVAQTPPDVLTPLAGVKVTDYRRMPNTEARPLSMNIDGVNDSVQTGFWAEQLETDADTTIVARWSDQWFNNTPAITRRKFGAGSVYYVGTFFTPELTKAILPALLTDSGVAPLITGLPDRVEVVRRVGDGYNLTFILNNREEPVTIQNTLHGRDLLNQTRAPAQIQLPAFGVSVIRSES